MTIAIDPALAPAKKMLEEGIAFVARAGLKVEALRKGYVKLALPLEPNRNHIGTIYAGALFTVAEIPGGALFLSSFDATRYYPIVKSLHLHFKKPATSAVSVEAMLSDADIAHIAATAEAEGKAEFPMNVEVKDAAGQVVAISEGIYQLRKLGR